MRYAGLTDEPKRRKQEIKWLKVNLPQGVAKY